MEQALLKETPHFTVELKVTPEKLKLFLIAKPGPKVQEASRDDLLAVIRECTTAEGIEIGVLDEVLKQLKQGHEASERRILKGTEAIKGADGRLLLLVKKFTGSGIPRADKFGRVSLTDVHAFD